jgi:hypothetical protein
MLRSAMQAKRLAAAERSGLVGEMVITIFM